MAHLFCYCRLVLHQRGKHARLHLWGQFAKDIKEGRFRLLCNDHCALMDRKQLESNNHFIKRLV